MATAVRLLHILKCRASGKNWWQQRGLSKLSELSTDQSISTNLKDACKDSKPGCTVMADEKPKPGEMEPWQKWINYDSPYKDDFDKLNRMRHYFYYVNSKGKLLRARIDKEGFEGEIRDERFKDRFFSNLKRNTDFPQYLPGYPFLSINVYDHYFCRYSHSPIVFTELDLEEDSLTYGASLTTHFSPESLQFCESTGALFHPVESGA